MEFRLFKNLPVLYGISSAADGNMRLGFSGSQKNRESFFKKEGIAEKNFISADLIHGLNVYKASKKAAKIIPRTDALITSNPALVLCVTVADCFPVYFYDAAKNVIGLAHCGWRGIVGNLAAKTIYKMGSAPEDVTVGIGPGIQSCHFEIKADILDKFKSYPRAIVRGDKKIFADLPAIITKQLQALGIKKINNSSECTYCSPKKYFSFRRDKPQNIEAMVAYISLLA